jgi:hypothetical protein
MADIHTQTADVTDARVADGQLAPPATGGADNVPTPAGNAVIGQLRTADDPKVADAFGVVHLADAGGQVQDTAKVMADMQQLYDKAIPDPQRRELFHTRMLDIQKYDPQTFDDMVKIASKIGDNPPLSAAETGKELATTLQDTIKRHSGPGNPADFDTDGLMAVLGGMSGLMLAERATFAAPDKTASTTAMVDAAEAQLRTQAEVNGIMKDDREPKSVIPVRVHGVMWGDNGEPALCAYSDNYKVDPHKFELRF